jgi:hypothetical protein
VGVDYDRDGIEIHFLNKQDADKTVKVQWAAALGANQFAEVSPDCGRTAGASEVG